MVELAHLVVAILLFGQFNANYACILFVHDFKFFFEIYSKKIFED